MNYNIDKQLNDFKKNIYSQSGEDGILEEIINRLGHKSDKVCCEFGAADGIHLSNTYNLIKNKNFSGILIESVKSDYLKMCKNIPDKKIIKLNALVSDEGNNSLENILQKHHIKYDFDLLSIDIDGNDYYILKSLVKYKPKIIVIEYNPTIPNDYEFVQDRNTNINQGASILSIFKLAKKKDYELVAITDANAIFVYESYFKEIVKKENHINDLRNDKEIKNYIFYGYDGKVFTSQKLFLPWHSIGLNEIKILPKFLQKYRREYNLFQRIIYLILLIFNKRKKLKIWISNPVKYIKIFYKFIKY